MEASSPEGLPLAIQAPVGNGLRWMKPARRPKPPPGFNPLENLKVTPMPTNMQLRTMMKVHWRPQPPAPLGIQPPPLPLKRMGKRKRQSDQPPTEGTPFGRFCVNRPYKKRNFDAATLTNDYTGICPKIWTPDAGLGLWTRMRMCLEGFSRNVAFSVHPAVLEEENLRMTFDRRNSDSLSGASALSLYIHIGLCIGAWMERDQEVERDSWEKARQQAGELFDEKDYYVSSALMFMSIYSLYCRVERDKASYYSELAELLCEGLDCKNSEVYARVCCYNALCSPDPSQALERWHDKMQVALRLPYHYVMTPEEVRARSSIMHLSNDNTTETELIRGHNYLTVSYSHSLLSYTLAIIYTLLRTKASLPGERLTVLLEKLEPLFREWEATATFGLKPSQRLMTSALFASIISELFVRAGQQEKALAWATHYLVIIDHPLFGYVPGLYSSAMPILQFFAAGQWWGQLQRLLHYLRPLQKRYTTVAPLIAPYEKLLLELPRAVRVDD